LPVQGFIVEIINLLLLLLYVEIGHNNILYTGS